MGDTAVKVAERESVKELSAPPLTLTHQRSNSAVHVRGSTAREKRVEYRAVLLSLDSTQVDE